MGTGRPQKKLEQERPRRLRTGAAATAGILFSVGLSTTSFVGDTGASQAKGFLGVASAQGVRLTYAVPQYSTFDTFEAGGSVSQAAVDAGGRRVAFSSSPYPGDLGVAAPGLVALVLGESLPAYPFYVSADYPVVPHSELEDPSGSYHLDATAGSGDAVGFAKTVARTNQATISETRADSSGVVTDAGGVTVRAETVATGLSFGDGMLRIASVESRSITTFAPGTPEPKTTVELHIDGATVSGQPVGIGPDGVRVGGQTPLPVASPVDLNETLGEAGITARIIDGGELAGGASSDVLAVSVSHPVPQSTTMGTLTYRFGGATTFITLGGSFGSQPGISPPSRVVSPPSAGGGSAFEPTAPSPSAPPVVGRARQPTATVNQTWLVARDLRDPMRFFYWIFLVAGTGVLVGSVLWRVKGVRVNRGWIPWTS